MTPSYSAAASGNEEDEFMEKATIEWLHRFPTDIFPGTPAMLLAKWEGNKSVLDWIVTKELNKEFEKPGIPFVKAKQHLRTMFQLNTTMGTVKTIKKTWEELEFALMVYDCEYPVDGTIELTGTTYLARDKEYVCFVHRSAEQQLFDLLWSYQEFDYDSD
ncbi:hypothetical protein VKT23_008645 [Stygiomarasmius scandens]|uniref:Uncharacterized protein n=1 Tax=Marasmiellus scandens TaxID=2682957 RepID=A0ABR1JH06_9AGAR